MAKFVVIFLCLAVIQASLALKCKRCKDTSCSALEDEPCQASPAGQEAACVTFRYTNADGKNEMTEKRCVVKMKDAKFPCTKTKSTDIEVQCDTCTVDFCNEKNAAPRAAALGVVAVVVALLVPTFM